jgi:VanZ family protein
MEYAILGLLLLRAIDRELVAAGLGIAYAVSDEIHQSFVTGRQGAPRDVLIDAVGVLAGVYLFPRLVRRVVA